MFTQAKAHAGGSQDTTEVLHSVRLTDISNLVLVEPGIRYLVERSYVGQDYLMLVLKYALTAVRD
jgi:hypothetical protein